MCRKCLLVFFPLWKRAIQNIDWYSAFFSNKASSKEQSVETLYCSSYHSTIPSRQSSTLCPLVLPHCLPLDGFPCFTLLFFFFFIPFHMTSTLLISFSFSWIPNPSLPIHFSAFFRFISSLSFSSLSTLLPFLTISPPSLKVYVLLLPLCAVAEPSSLLPELHWQAAKAC